MVYGLLGGIFCIPAPSSHIAASLLAIPEHALYAGANLLTIPPAVLGKSASIINATRTKTYSTLAGKADAGLAA